MDTKSVDIFGHTDTESVDKLGHMDTKSVDISDAWTQKVLTFDRWTEGHE